MNWSERGDLNSRPPVPQTGALTRLRYAPNLTGGEPALPQMPVRGLWTARRGALRLMRVV